MPLLPPNSSSHSISSLHATVVIGAVMGCEDREKTINRASIVSGEVLSVTVWQRAGQIPVALWPEHTLVVKTHQTGKTGTAAQSYAENAKQMNSHMQFYKCIFLVKQVDKCVCRDKITPLASCAASLFFFCWKRKPRHETQEKADHVTSIIFDST